MMQRLLRGHIFYGVFGLFVALLYWQASRQPPVQLLPVPEAVPGHQALEWWPATVSSSTLQHRLMQEPSLAIVVTVLAVFIIGMCAGSVVLTGWGLWKGQARAVWQFPSTALPRWSLGEFTRILLLIVLVASLMPFVHLALIFYDPSWIFDTRRWLAVSMLVLDLVVILMVLTFAEGKGQGRSVWSVLGISGRRLTPSVETGLRGYLVVFPWLFVMLFVIVTIAHAFGLEPPTEPIHQLIFEEHRPMVLACTFALACFIGPLAEELFFRGVVYPTIRQRTSRLLGMLLSGSAFALLHTNPVGFLPIMLLGSVLAYLYERTGSLTSPLAIHILHNTFLMVMTMTFRRLLM